MSKKYFITKNNQVIQERNDYIEALKLLEGCHTPRKSLDVYRLFGHQRGFIQPIAYKIGAYGFSYGTITDEVAGNVGS